MFLQSLALKNFRCFSDQKIEFDRHLTLIEGLNGSGKTTIIEALYYLGYLRSFRTSLTQDLIKFGAEEFFLKAELGQGSLAEETLQVGFSPQQRSVKLSERRVESFRQLLQSLRIVVLTEEDLELVRGEPERRRSFIDQQLCLQNPALMLELRHFRKILHQRNALLKSTYYKSENYQLWTNQLEQKTQLIREHRKTALGELAVVANELLQAHFLPNSRLDLVYQPKNWVAELEAREHQMERSLFGAHLDDYQIQLSERSGRKYASRGQQKLLVILIKMAQIMLLKQSFDGTILFLLDDFVTDLDETRVGDLIKLLGQLDVQLVFTTPNLSNSHRTFLLNQGGCIISV